jgi:hypothetical protein
MPLALLTEILARLEAHARLRVAFRRNSMQRSSEVVGESADIRRGVTALERSEWTISRPNTKAILWNGRVGGR